MNSLTPEQFDSEYRAVFDLVFLPAKTATSNPWAIPFRNRSWQVVAVPAPHNFEPSEYHALRSAALAVGDTKAVIMDAEAEPRPLYPGVFSWPEAWLAELSKGDARFAVDLALFGRSASWGVYLLWESGLAYVGGEPAFMDAFLGEMGGVETIKRRLQEWVRETDDAVELGCISRTLVELGWDAEVVLDKLPTEDTPPG